MTKNVDKNECIHPYTLASKGIWTQLLSECDIIASTGYK